MKQVIVIHERDKSDNDRRVIGVASNREKALSIIDEHYGKGQHVITDFKDIRENNLDFSCSIEVEGVYGGFYKVWGEDFCIDSV
jgi:hypothetical protein